MGDIEISASLNRKGLSDALNMALSLSPVVPFDFKINGNFLRQSLSAALRQYQISSENVVQIEYFPAFKPPMPEDEQKTDDWISCLKFKGKDLFYSLYDGTVHCGEKVWKGKEDEDGDKVPFKSFAFIGENRLVAGGIDGSGTIFTLDDSEEPKTMDLHNSAVNDIASNPLVDQMFVTAGADYCLALWSLEKNLQPFVGHTDSVTGVVWDTPETLYSCSLDRSIRCWDVNKFEETNAMSANSGVLSIAVNGSLIVSTHADRTAKLWDTRVEEKRAVVREFKAHTNWVSKVQFLNSEVFVTGGYDGGVKLWNIGTSVPLFTISQQDEKVFAVAVEDNMIATGGTGKVIRRSKAEQ
jgi:ribosome biogenesis protein YTM1